MTESHQAFMVGREERQESIAQQYYFPYFLAKPLSLEFHRLSPPNYLWERGNPPDAVCAIIPSYYPTSS